MHEGLQSCSLPKVQAPCVGYAEAMRDLGLFHEITQNDSFGLSVKWNGLP